MDNSSIKSIVIEPAKGATFEQISRDALSACLKYICEIRFTFNGNDYKVTPVDMYMAIKDQSVKRHAPLLPV